MHNETMWVLNGAPAAESADARLQSSTIGRDRPEAVSLAKGQYLMPIKTKPFGCQEQFDWGADIHSVSYDGRLVVRVQRNRNHDDGIEVQFSRVGGFRLLDEVPLAEYWTDEDFPSGYPVLEVLDGGWAKEEDRRLGYTKEQREWIVVTAGACVSIFSECEPAIVDAVWPKHS